MGLMWITAPISWPIGKLLDIWLGVPKPYRYDNQSLQALIMLHSRKALEEAFHHDGHGDDSSGMETAGPKGLDERTLTLL